MTKHDLVILYSGGADSRLMLEFALQLKRKPYCVLIDYEQKHIKELDFAIKQIENIVTKVPYQIVKLHDLKLNSGLTGDLQSARWENVHSENVPGRNTMFLSIAFSIAENLDIQEIWFGADYSDRENLFPDCYQEYVYKINELFKISGVKPIKVIAPLLGWTKDMVVDYLKKTCSITNSDMFSGYEEPTTNVVR